jgi:predicted RNA-binding protein with PUA-like domain
MRFWLMKTEPGEFSLAHLKALPGQTSGWDGVRNYQARNFMRDDMRVGDRVLFYHSSTKSPAVAGTARIVRAAYPDAGAWDPHGPRYDPRSTPQRPVWVMVDVQFEAEFAAPVTLAELRGDPRLRDMPLLRRGMRLSIQPVTPEEFAAVVERGRRKGPP